MMRKSASYIPGSLINVTFVFHLRSESFVTTHKSQPDMSSTYFNLVCHSWRSYDTCDKLLESYCELNVNDEYKFNSLLKQLRY